MELEREIIAKIISSEEPEQIIKYFLMELGFGKVVEAWEQNVTKSRSSINETCSS